MQSSVKQRPPWYRGLKLRQWLESEKYGELSGHELDEIIDESLTNPYFSWHGAAGLASFLGLDQKALRDMIWTWNGHKIRLYKLQQTLLRSIQKSARSQLHQR